MKFNFKVPSMVRDRKDFNLSHSHVLTQNFGVINVVSAIDVKPGDDLTIDVSAFTRLMPLPCPTYGGVKVTHRAYAVNFDFIIRHFSEFLKLQRVSNFYYDNPNPEYTSLLSLNIPYFQPYSVMLSLINDFDDMVEEVASTAQYDFDWSTAPGGHKYYVYTSKGRRVVSWLSQLGYKMPSSLSGLAVQTKYDCLALFAFWKFYLEWVVPARFLHLNKDFNYIKSILDDFNCTGEGHLLYSEDYDNLNSDEIAIKSFLKVPTSFLEDDQYTTAFVNSYSVEDPVSYDFSNVEGLQVNAGYDSRTNPVVQGLNNPLAAGSGVAGFATDNSNASQYNKINQLSLLSLGRLQKMVNNQKITSTKVLDWLRTEYGITPSSDSLRMSKYLGAFDSQIMIGDVMATATTDSNMGTTVVGQYAGKGIGGSSAKWRLKCDFTGIIFVTSEISTKSSYPNGISPLRSRFNALQFFHPEFDNVGMRAIPVTELRFNTFDKGSDYSTSGIFGFAPRYSEYKFKNDEVTGDFMFPSVNTGLDSWYLSRKFSGYEPPHIGLEFCSATSDSAGSLYDRIFQNQNNVDHFYSVYKIDIHETSFMESVFDYFKTISESEHDKDVDVSIN